LAVDKANAAFQEDARLEPLVTSEVRIVRKLVPPGVLALNQALPLAFRMNAVEP
jgi:hypothetical protein